MVAAHTDSVASERAPARAAGHSRPATKGVRLALLFAWPAVLTLGFLATFDAFSLGEYFAVAAWTSGLWVTGATIVTGLRDLKAADARTLAALDRAMAAETVQRARADELADVIRASEGLVLLGRGKLDFMGILAAITPAGATSFMAQVQDDSDSVVVAAHGPLAPWFIGLRQAPDAASGDPDRALTSYSASGTVVGTAAPTIHAPGLDSEVEAALSVRFADHTGGTLGWLHLLDRSASESSSRAS